MAVHTQGPSSFHHKNTLGKCRPEGTCLDCCNQVCQDSQANDSHRHTTQDYRYRSRYWGCICHVHYTSHQPQDSCCPHSGPPTNQSSDHHAQHSCMFHSHMIQLHCIPVHSFCHADTLSDRHRCHYPSDTVCHYRVSHMPPPSSLPHNDDRLG